MDAATLPFPMGKKLSNAMIKSILGVHLGTTGTGPNQDRGPLDVTCHDLKHVAGYIPNNNTRDRRRPTGHGKRARLTIVDGKGILHDSASTPLDTEVGVSSEVKRSDEVDRLLPLLDIDSKQIQNDHREQEDSHHLNVAGRRHGPRDIRSDNWDTESICSSLAGGLP